MFKALSNDSESECRDLEKFFNSDFNFVLFDDRSPQPQPREMKRIIQSKDCELSLRLSGDSNSIGWPHLWDMALENREKCIEVIKNLVKVIITML